jgi:hypothetical protein
MTFDLMIGSWSEKHHSLQYGFPVDTHSRSTILFHSAMAMANYLLMATVFVSDQFQRSIQRAIGQVADSKHEEQPELFPTMEETEDDAMKFWMTASEK